MTISGAIRQGIDVAVFTRNYREHLEEAASISATDPNRHIVFRAQTKWASASTALIKKRPRDLYIAPVGGNGLVEYVADLHDVHFNPQRGQPQTEELLKLTTASTSEEGLWEQYGGQIVQTLYIVSNVRKLTHPFEMTKLVKISDDKPLSKDYGYSYSLVHSYDFESE